MYLVRAAVQGQGLLGSCPVISMRKDFASSPRLPVSSTAKGMNLTGVFRREAPSRRGPRVIGGLSGEDGEARAL